MTRILLSCLTLFFAVSSFAASDSTSPGDPLYSGTKARLGFGLGWEHPYSFGMELSFSFNEIADFNMGLGLGPMGAKVGVGARVYPMRFSKVSPMVGVHVFHATGLSNVDLTNNNNGESAVYNIIPDNALLISGGMRLRSKSGDYFLATLGYSHAFDGRKSEYVDGSTDDVLKKTADIFGVGGFSFCLGYLIRLGR
jgi:hypothetical protein